MRKYAEKLVTYSSEYLFFSLWRYGKSRMKRCGNHAVILNPISTVFLDDTGKSIEINNPSRVFTYHDNVICVVSDHDNKFWLSHAGWYTSSTSQALNQYRELFQRRGYKCMTD